MKTNQHTSQKVQFHNQKVRKGFLISSLIGKLLMMFRLIKSRKHNEDKLVRSIGSQHHGVAEPVRPRVYFQCECEFERDLMKTLPPSKLMTNLKN